MFVFFFNASIAIFDFLDPPVNFFTSFANCVFEISLLSSGLKRFKGREGARSDVKKAIVTVKKGQEINFGKLE